MGVDDIRPRARQASHETKRDVGLAKLEIGRKEVKFEAFEANVVSFWKRMSREDLNLMATLGHSQS